MKKGIELRVVGIGLVIAGVLFALAVPTSLMGQEAAEAAKSMRLKLKVLKTYPQPVIDEKTPGVEGIKGGYECGNTVKVMIDGKPEYHFFAWRMPGLGWENLGTDQLVSQDGFAWRRVGALTEIAFDKQIGKYIQSGPAQPFYDEATQRWELYYNRFECVTTNWQAGSTLWRAQSKVEGIAGIRGPWDFPGKQFMFPGTSYPKASIAQSITSPFQTKSGQWAVLMGGNGSPYQPKYGSWWVLVSTAPTPQGPYTFDEKHSPATMIDPTGGIENPTVTKVRGPLTGREYWVSTFDFLHPQPNNAIGFTWSEDGLDWPMTNGQALVIDEGLAPGETGWWKGTIGTWSIRTPHQLIDEGDGTYTVFFTGSTRANYFTGFRAVGRMQVRLVEEPVAHE
jgi:Na+-transporting methylmalonyl-CoA/oxaloacetate decarboxylase gamma subunit